MPTWPLLLLVGCAGRPAPANADMLAIGDSIFEAHRSSGRSIPDVVAERTGHVVHNAAKSGAWATDGGGVPTIPEQRVDGDFAWLVMDGGANDLNGRCRCGDCDAVLDELITEDATDGVLVAIVEEAVAQGMRVAFMGYPELPDDARFGFSRCGDQLAEHRRRRVRLAERVDGMWFVDASEVVGATDLPYFVDDHVHPSVEGSRVMGEHIVEQVRELSKSSPAE